MTHTAAVTSINQEYPAGTWTDTITISDGTGEDVESVTVESSEDEAPYVAALLAAGWVVTGTDPSRRDATGGDAWTVQPVGNEFPQAAQRTAGT